MVVQEIMGYVFYNGTEAQKMFFFYGSGGNGKSVLLNIIIALVGKGNYTTIPIRELSKSFSRAELKDVALNCSSENENLIGKPMDSQYLKSITTGDAVVAERKYKDPMVFNPFCKLIFSINSLPNVTDKSNGFSRRILIVPFEQTFSLQDGTADVNLEKKLKKELPGIFNFAMEGLKRLKANNFKFTECKAINKYLKEMEIIVNPYLIFWEEYIYVIDNVEEQYREVKSSVYYAFCRWAIENNHKNLATVSTTKFWLDFQEVAVKKTGSKLKTMKMGVNRYIMGICLKTHHRPIKERMSTPTVNLRLSAGLEIRWDKENAKGGYANERQIKNMEKDETDIIQD